MPEVSLDTIITPNRKRGLNPEKIKGLASSMHQNGLLHPITLNENNVLLAGLHRLEAARNLEWKTISAIIKSGLDALQAELIEIDENLIRDELTPLQQGTQLNRRNQILEELGLRAKVGAPPDNNHAAKNKGEIISPLFPLESAREISSQKTTAEIAAEAGLSERSAQQRMQIDKNLSQEVKDLIENTELEEGLVELINLSRLAHDLQLEVTTKILNKQARNVDEATKQIKKEQRKADIEQQRQEIALNRITPPGGLFDVIVVDPPWPYGTNYDPNGRRVANPYPEMSLEEIAAINLPAKPNCILWLWTTHKFMRYSFGILDTWGFRDVAIVTWVKDKMGIGTWLRSQTEFCIMAIRGKPTIDLSNQVTIIYGNMREHSRKPDSFYEMVDSLCVGYKLDYFSRERRAGWISYGNDTEKF